MTLRVALDHGPLLDPPTGIGRYTRELAEHLTVQGVDVAPFAISLRGSRPGIPTWRMPAKVVHAAWRAFGRPSLESLVGRVDVAHGTNFVAPVAGAPAIVTVHDLSFLDADAAPVRRHWARMVPWSVERAARVLVPSHAVAGEIQDHYGIDPAKIVVTHEGVSRTFFGAMPMADSVLAERGIRRPFALAVGTIAPRKNLRRLLAAWSIVQREHPEWQLVVAGPSGWGPELPETSGVVTTGWVGDETLPGLLAAADLFCFPSLYEGFGLPPLEAMAAGTAAVVGSYPAAAEVVGDDAVIVDPGDVASIAAGIAGSIGDEARRADLARRGRARAAAFTWERTARLTLEAYRAAAEGGSS
ncbi:MAG TPA: glycosyltransferase family 1 protein [Actinomycetota bacterium]|nr:glycosyltransferase family 1 protein [Actinomycetota bacterium]